MRLGVDILMPLDECVLAPHRVRPRSEAALRRTTAWAERSARVAGREPIAISSRIVQGGLDADLRRDHAAQLAAIGFPGYAVGGLSVGEERESDAGGGGGHGGGIAGGAAALPDGRGVAAGSLRFIGMGYDLFDCVLPTRNGRNGSCFTCAGRVNIRLARYARDGEPLDPGCACSGLPPVFARLPAPPGRRRRDARRPAGDACTTCISTWS